MQGKILFHPLNFKIKMTSFSIGNYEVTILITEN